MGLFDKLKRNKIDKPRTVYVEAVTASKKAAVMPFILQVALLYICLIGFLYCVTTSLQSEISIFVVALIAFVPLVIAALFSINTKVFIGFLSAFVLAVLSVIFLFKDLFETIIDSFEFCFNRTIQIVVDEGYLNYQSSMTEDITEKLSDFQYMQDCFYCVLIVLAIVFSVIFTVAMMKRSMVWLCTIPCFLILTPSLYFGAVPSGPAFAIFLSGVLGCYVESISYSSLRKFKKQEKKDTKNKQEKKSKNIFLTSSALGGFTNALVVLVISLTVSVFVYSSDLLKLDKLREIIDDIAMHIMNTLFYEQYETAEAAIGGLIENDTLGLDTPEFRDLPVMDVTTRTNTALYLRGWIGKDLYDDGWKVVYKSDNEQFKSRIGKDFDPYTQFYNFMTLMSTNELTSAESEKDTKNLGFVFDTIGMKAYFTKSQMLFLPISGIDGKVTGEYKGIEKIGDTVCFFEGGRPKGNSYTMNSALQSFTSSNFYVAIKQKQKNYLAYANNIKNKQNLTTAEQFILNERKYSEYVRDTYLNVPEKSEYFENLAETITEKYSHDFDKALAIERYLKTGYQYSITTNIVGDNAVSKIEYVIKDGKVGYCTYYASAMTLMLRHMDIPARYVIGYHSKTQPESGQKYLRKLVDKNYHAWVEVYLDGIGWLTFDPTPGYGNNAPIRDYDYLDKETPAETPEPDNSPTEQPQTPQPVQPPKVHEVIENVPEAAKDPTVLLIIIGSVFAAVLLLFAIILFLKSVNSRYNKMFEKLKKTNKTVMVRNIYPKLLTLLAGYGLTVKEGEVVSEFAQRVDAKITLEFKLLDVIAQLEMAQFSENEIKFENAKNVFLYFKALSDCSLKKFNVFKRLYYKIKLVKK